MEGKLWKTKCKWQIMEVKLWKTNYADKLWKVNYGDKLWMVNYGSQIMEGELRKVNYGW